MPPTTAVEGRKWIVEDQDIYSCCRYWRDGKLGPARWAASLAGIREGAWFAWDDLAPFWLMYRSLLASCARWVARKLFLPARSRTAS
ncbi:hypothetical protein D3C83_44940 [compost metagenome]